jgi:hypothetical protein
MSHLKFVKLFLSNEKDINPSIILGGSTSSIEIIVFFSFKLTFSGKFGSLDLLFEHLMMYKKQLIRLKLFILFMGKLKYFNFSKKTLEGKHISIGLKFLETLFCP